MEGLVREEAVKHIPGRSALITCASGVSTQSTSGPWETAMTSLVDLGKRSKNDGIISKSNGIGSKTQLFNNPVGRLTCIDLTQCSPIELLKQDAANENFNRRWVFDEIFKLSTAD
jgi:hypothetical protein